MEPYTHYQEPPPSVNGGNQFTAVKDLIAMQGFKLMSNINCNLDFLDNELHLTSYAYSEADCSIQAAVHDKREYFVSISVICQR